MLPHRIGSQAAEDCRTPVPWNEGQNTGWHKTSAFDACETKREIPVPSCWERFEKHYEGVAHCHRAFRVPADRAVKIVRLQFDAVNFMAEVWRLS